MKKLEKGKFYSIKVNHHGRELDYEGQVTAVKEGEFVFNTPETCRLVFKIKDLIFVKEIDPPEKKDIEIITRRKGPLREADKPEGL